MSDLAGVGCESERLAPLGAGRSRSARAVVVEDYVSVLAADAIGRVRSVGLCPAVERARTPEPERCGQVVGQEPPAGEQLLRGQLVQLFVAERAPHGPLQPSTTARNGQRSGLAETSAGSPRGRKRAGGRTGSVSSGDGGSRAAAMHARDPDGDVWSEYFEEGKSPGDGQAPPRELLAAGAKADATAVEIVADAACDGELSRPGLDWRTSRTATLNRDRNGWGALTSRGHLARWMRWSLATGGVVLGLFTVAVVTGGSHAMKPPSPAGVSNVAASRADVVNALPKVAAAALHARTKASARRRGMHGRDPKAASAPQDSRRRRTSAASAAPVSAPASSSVPRSDARRQGSAVAGFASGRARQTPLAGSAPAAVSSPAAVSRPASIAPLRVPPAGASEESGPMQFFRP